MLGGVQVDDAGLKGLHLCSTIITIFENPVKETECETKVSLNCCNGVIQRRVCSIGLPKNRRENLLIERECRARPHTL